MRRRITRFLLWVVSGLVVLLVALVTYVDVVSRVRPPKAPPTTLAGQSVRVLPSGLHTLGKNWFRESDSGLFELYVEGDAYDRGLANGKLSEALVQHQEEVFTEQIHRLVPNSFYLGLLKRFVGWFNRDLSENVPDEFKLEILGISQSASHEFDEIAPPYQRILNYHAAHDIGHALQNMSLVGCTSFATWGESSADSSLIVGRNFDFYVGDDFARDKIVAFYHPSKGFDFMMVTFGGMTGVLSGMNKEGLTVTINAAKSEIPSHAATPVSLVAREILQYASTIEEAYAIARKREMFVSESFLIASAKDGKAAVIEKSQNDIDYFESDSSTIICTNHFQGPRLANSTLNVEHVRDSASPYRYARVAELLRDNWPNTVERTAALLRNQGGLQGANIGTGNEKLVNQLIAHHAVIFEPEKGLAWISTAPWQLGKFVCYDLNEVFATASVRVDNEEMYLVDREIPQDPFVLTGSYRNFVKFSPFRFPFGDRSDLMPDSLIKWNPDLYLSYLLAGDYYLEHGAWDKAAGAYEIGLGKEIATAQEREHMEKNLRRVLKQME